MKIYNSKSGVLEEFKSVTPGVINMYVCGPTVYSDIHIGNARPIIFFDIVARYFRAIGNEVTYVSNVTDIDDKIIKRAIELSLSEKQLTEITTKKYLDILEKLNVELSFVPKVTTYINEIIDFIVGLVEDGYAYIKDGDVYFRSNKIEDYGKLSNRNINEQINGIRIEQNVLKEFDSDFVLWKKTEEGLAFDSPFSKGRPGWHTECVVIIHEIFKKTIDIHGGGIDLKFPHHENENAQSTACGCELANYWMHNGFVNYDSEKMSKSLGNVVLVKDLLKKYNANTIRLLLIQSNYRSPINLTTQFIENTKNLEKKLQALRVKCGEYDAIFDLDDQYVKMLLSEFENDFNIANVITLLLQWSKNEFSEVKEAYKFAFYVLNINIDSLEIPKEVSQLIEERSAAKKNKDFKLADELRKQINSLGYDVLDTRDGVKCQKI